MTEQKFYSGKDGRVLENGRPVAKVSAWRFRSNIPPLPTTSLADYAEDYTAGVSAASGSMTIWYYADAPSSIISRIVSTKEITDEQRVILELGWGPNRIRGTVMFTSIELGPRAGEVMAVDCDFVFCGPLQEIAL